MPDSECQKHVNSRSLEEGHSVSGRDGQGNFMEEVGFKQDREERKDISGWCVCVGRRLLSEHT